MQTTAIGTVANSLPENEAILLTILISDGYIPYTDFKEYFRLTEALSLNLPPNAYTEIFVHD